MDPNIKDTKVQKVLDNLKSASNDFYYETLVKQFHNQTKLDFD